MARRPKKTTPRKIIYDTDVLIWYFRGNTKARSLLEKTEQENRTLSSLTLMELYQGCRNQDELLDVQTFVAENISQILHPRTSISEKAIHLIETHSLSNGLRVADSIIAASALVHRAVLVTGNDRHFRFIPGLEIRSFKP